MEGVTTKRIVIGVDGSEHAAAALDWAISMAKQLQAEVVAVFAIPPPNFLEYGAGYAVPVTPVELDPEWRSEMEREFKEQWCKALQGSGLRYRTVVEDGRAASVISAVADREEADLVVVGRRGRGGVAEMLLGSVSHELSHHCTRPVVLISNSRSANQRDLVSATTTPA